MVYTQVIVSNNILQLFTKNDLNSRTIKMLHTNSIHTPQSQKA